MVIFGTLERAAPIPLGNDVGNERCHLVGRVNPGRHQEAARRVLSSTRWPLPSLYTHQDQPRATVLPLSGRHATLVVGQGSAQPHMSPRELHPCGAILTGRFKFYEVVITNSITVTGFFFWRCQLELDNSYSYRPFWRR